MRCQKGFTLIELIVVVAIIAIVSIIAVALFGSAQKQARDATRRSGIDAVAKAVESHYNSALSQYPTTILDTWFAGGVKPKDPSTGMDYDYQVSTDRSGFQVCATLESGSSFCKPSAQGQFIASSAPTSVPTSTPTVTPAPTSGTSSNLALNPGCETATTGFWYPYLATVASDSLSTTPHSGSASCKLTNTTGATYDTLSNYTSVVKSPTPIINGAQYIATAWVKSDSLTAGKNVEIHLKQSGGTTAVNDKNSASTQTYTLSTNWQQITVSTTINAPDRTALDVYLVQIGTPGNVMYVDDISVSLVSSYTACVPGTPESVNNGYNTYKSTQTPNAVFPCSGWRPYADSAIFNQPVPANPTINVNSSAIVQAWFTRVPADISIGLSNSTSTTYKDWSHPVYFSQSSDPLYTITCTKYGGACEISGAQIRIPVGAKPANGGDGHMAIIEQSTNTEYDFWQAAIPSGTGGPLSISWGGKTDITIDGLNSDSTAAAFGGAAGMVRGAEWSAGVIDHALFITIQCDNGQIIYGGHGTKCGTTANTLTENPLTAPPMGARFYLAMTDSQIDATGLASWKKILMKAMAHYGMYFGDTGGSNTWEIKPESGFSYTSFGYTDPLVTFASANCNSYQDFWLCKFPEMKNYAGNIYMINP